MDVLPKSTTVTKEIIKTYLSDTVGGKVFMVCGLSMGGRIAATLAGYEDVEIGNQNRHKNA